jgi:hypothetical protein
MFVEKIQGVLMGIVVKEGGNEYEVWFPYTKNFINVIREGVLLAVKNFASKDDVEHLSVLQVTSVMPMHYALGTDRTGYPGFVEEAAINAAQDWQQETPTEDTTKIKCLTAPSYVEIIKPSVLGGTTGEPKKETTVGTESNMPMIGERVSMLNSEWTQRIVNRGLTSIADKTITLGTLYGYADVSILALWEEMIQTHFGIFAYTKAGKSNLVSTCISKIIGKPTNAKVIVLDMMSEYGALLIDVLCTVENACIVCCRPESVPGSVVEYWSDPSDNNLKKAAEDIVKTTLLPKALKEKQPLLVEPVKQLLESKKIRLFSESRKVGEIIDEAKDELLSGNLGNLKSNYRSFIETLVSQNEKIEISNAAIDNVAREIDNWVANPPQIGGDKSKVSPTIWASAERLKKILVDAKAGIKATESIKPEFTIKLSEIVSALNEESYPSIFIAQSNMDEDLRQFAFSLGNIMLSYRRRTGLTSPLVSFVFDEADMFIPSGDSEERGIGMSRYIARELARRGRKYGLGIGIATQRIVYLDTNVLGQPHTYFISKLPRAADRQRIQEAFGISDEAMRQTLRFEKGQWMLVSDDATGMEGVPIPIKVPDANTRIIDFLETFKK